MNLETLKSSFKNIESRLADSQPACCVILGSGWSDIIGTCNVLETISYTDIPVMATSSIKGHAGEIQIVENSGKQYIFFLGRHHWYEGIGWEPIAFPVYTTKMMKIPSILLTNSAGSVSKNIGPGSLMIIDDHINDMGVNPLCDKYDSFWGPQFPDQSSIYSINFRNALDTACANAGIEYCHGVYAAKSGPTYETPAETRALHSIGASAVGMSTVPEAMLANSLGLNVGGLSCVTNYAAGICDMTLSHEEVLLTTSRAKDGIKKVIFETLLAI